MISVVIYTPSEPWLGEIGTWLMTCRVLGRKVKHRILSEILQCASEAKIYILAAIYKPRDRSRLVVDYLVKLAFPKVGEDESGLTRWGLLVEDAIAETAPMKVVSLGFTATEEKSLV